MGLGTGRTRGASHLRMKEVGQVQAIFEEALHRTLSHTFPRQGFSPILMSLSQSDWPPQVEALLQRIQTYAFPLSAELSVWCSCICNIATAYVIVQQLETAQDLFQELIERDVEQPDQNSARREALAKALIEAAQLAAQTTDADSKDHR